MSLKTEITDLTHSDRPWVAERAKIAEAISEQHAAGQLDADEAKELLADLIATDKLDKDADDMEMKEELQRVINGLIAAIEVASSL